VSEINGKFACPRCGSQIYSSMLLKDGTLQRVCRGVISGISCLYSWHESRDREHGLAPRPRAAVEP
jgi:transcription elongation factor Elf1